jgi:hypothetical protein
VTEPTSAGTQGRCYVCSAPAEHEVDEVWFDFGEPIMRFVSSKDYAGEAPWMCVDHKKSMAHALASAVLEDRHSSGATGPLWPERWWVRYADGHVIGGQVGPRP